MTDNADKSWFTNIRTVLLTQALTVILTPACIAVTLYLIDSGKAPKPDIRYVNAYPQYIQSEPSFSLVAKINDNPGLASDFRSIVRQASISKDDGETCAAWLDGGSWDSDCLAVYESVTNQMRGVLREAMAQGHGSIQESRARDSLKILEELKKELTSVEATKQPRAGNVALTVGVLNTGGSDGTVFADALLKFNNKLMHVSAGGYTAVGAHGFSEIVFATAREDGGKFLGSFTEGEEPAIKAWSDLVKGGHEIPFELTITLSGKSDVIKGTVPKAD